MHRVLTVWLLVSLGPLACAGSARGTDWQRMPESEFAKLPAVNAPIDFARFDPALMAAAIFHETNRIRRQLGLQPFKHLAKLDEAADLQAGMGAMLAEVSHRNPIRALANLGDRMSYVGLDYESAEENIALASALEGDPPAEWVGVRGAGATREFFDMKTGRLFGLKTYAAFATAVLRQWMDSPDHRANIISEKVRYLGCSARWRKDLNGVDLLYAVQVFFSPRPTG